MRAQSWQEMEEGDQTRKSSLKSDWKTSYPAKHCLKTFLLKICLQNIASKHSFLLGFSPIWLMGDFVMIACVSTATMSTEMAKKLKIDASIIIKWKKNIPFQFLFIAMPLWQSRHKQRQS